LRLDPAMALVDTADHGHLVALRGGEIGGDLIVRSGLVGLGRQQVVKSLSKPLHVRAYRQITETVRDSHHNVHLESAANTDSTNTKRRTR